MMFKVSFFLPLFLGASLASAIPSQIVKRTTPVKADYEDITFSGIPLLTQDKPLPFYKQLQYSGFLAVDINPLQGPLIRPNGLKAVISQNLSSISAQYTGSPVSAFIPNSAYFGCFFSDNTATVPGVTCTVQVTAFQPDGIQYGDQASCFYGGTGTLTPCTFPVTWTNVGKLSFNILTSTILSETGTGLGNLLGGLSPGLAKVGIFFDDFTSTYKCISGKVNSASTGQCGDTIIPRATDSQLVVRSPGEVLSDYENIRIPGIPGVANNAPLTLYNQLTYSNFRAVHKVGTGTLFQQINGEQCAVGGNGSTITSVYLSSPVASFKANYASFGCYINTYSAVSPGVSCTVEVSALATDGTQYVDKAGCAYDGIGAIQKCTFPSLWTNVATLSFRVVASEILSTIGPTLGSLLGGLIGTVGSIGFILDDLDANFACVDGKKNSVLVGGLCE